MAKARTEYLQVTLIGRHYKKIAEVINKFKGQSQIVLIKKLNPIIRGWCNYYATVVSQKVFERIVHLVIWKLLKWGIKRHRNKGAKWVKNKYFKSESRFNKKEQRYTIRDWIFANKEIENNPVRLIQHFDTKITRYVKVVGNASPDNDDLIYWSSRMGKHPQMPKRTASLLKKQKGKCLGCNLYFKDEDVIELDHIKPLSKGGKDEKKNWQLLHRHCHFGKN